MKEAVRSTETSVLTRGTWLNNPKEGILLYSECPLPGSNRSPAEHVKSVMP
jgi:hypothetical protein